MKEADLNVIYVIQAYNRPQLLAPSLLSLRNQIMEKNRRILLLNDGPRTPEDVETAAANKMVFEAFFSGYPNIEYHLEPVSNGAELMFVKTFFRMFEDEKVDCFALLEDDLYYEKHYLDNVEKLLAQTYEDTDIASVSGFTRQTIHASNEILKANERKVVAQHNLIGAIYKRCGWPLLKGPFEEFMRLKQAGIVHHDDIYKVINEKYGLHMPHTAYDKIVDHIFAKNRKFRISTFNRYLFHMGLFGTSCVKSNEICHHNREALANLIRYDWHLLTTDSSRIENFILDKKDESLIYQLSKELDTSTEEISNSDPNLESNNDGFSFREWGKINSYESAVRVTISDDPKNCYPDKHLLDFCGDKSEKLRILDFGCGVGRNTFEFTLGRPWTVVGYDNDSMISKAGEFCKRYYNKTPRDFPDVQFSSDWSKLREETFDCIFACLVFQHVPETDIKRYLEDFRKMTKKVVLGGRRAHDSVNGNTWAILEKYGYFPSRTWSGKDVPYERDGPSEYHCFNIYVL